MSKVSYRDRSGALQEITLDATIYREAHDANLSVPQHLARKYPTDSEKYGSTFAQIASACGYIVKPGGEFGIRAPSVADLLEGKAMQAGTVVKEAAPASRIIFPSVILELIENALKKDTATQPQTFEELIAVSDTIAGDKFEQPVVDFTRPAGARHAGIAQGALPQTMLTLSLSDKVRRIPTFSLGLEATDQALKATSLDFVTMSLKRQAEVERDARVEQYIKDLVGGDADMGTSALTGVNQTTYDSGAATGTVTQKAWVKYLMNNFRKRHLSHVICDVDMALKIENRTGKPIITGDDPNSPRIDATFSLLNNKLQNVKMWIVDAGVVAANRVVGLDSRYAIRRVRNSEAEYQAAEEFVMKRVSQLRFDFGEIVYRLFDDAWDVMDLV